jgi:hypothetical protein
MSTASVRWGERLSTVKGPATRILVLSGIGLVVEVFEIGLGGDGGVDLLLPGDAGLPEPRQRGLGGLGPVRSGASRGISHSMKPFAGAVSPEGSVTSPVAVKSIFAPFRPPVSTLNWVAWPRRAVLRAAMAPSTAGCIRSQITSISALLAMDFSVMCGTRS